MLHNPVTQGPLDQAIFRLVIPEIGSQLLRWAFVTADAYFIGQLGGPQLSALSSASFFYWGLQALGLLLSIGVTAMVARRWGEGDHAGAKEAASQGVRWVLPYGLLCMLLTWIIAGPIMSHVAASPESAQGAVSFLWVVGLGTPFMFLGFVVDAAFKGSGDPRTPLLLLGIAAVANIVFDPILIFWLDLSLQGAAIATMGSQGLAALVGLFILYKRGRVSLDFRLASFDVSILLRLCRIGLPLALSSLLFSFIYIVISWLLRPFGDAAQAGLAVGHRIESLAYMISVAIGSATTTLVGQSLGANDQQRAWDAAWRCVRYAVLFSIFASVAMALFATQLADIFTNDEAVIIAGASYIFLTAFSEVGVAIEIVLEGGFGGAGDTVPPMVISMLYTAARIPLGWWFANGLGLGFEGVYIAITGTALLRGLTMAAWFYRGKWLHRTV